MIKYNIKNGLFEKDLPILDPFQFINKTFEMLLPHNALRFIIFFVVLVILDADNTIFVVKKSWP